MAAVQSASHSNVDDEVRHDRLTELTLQVPLGALLAQVVTPVEEYAEDEAERDATAALAIRSPYEPTAIAAMTNRLLTRIEGLAVGVERIPVCRRGASGVGALATWERLKAQAPAADPLGSWSYMRTLAHATHGMVHSLREHRSAEQPKAFVGRPGMPPVAPRTR
ncbi:hypothetical protein [Streptomyces sp. LMG1-1-1.1]|uniref:hypothetical protein n=1 Tax=Streptomyces sp. LMG1-1-1.1 TaxID=3135245 RepID=UPI0034668863